MKFKINQKVIIKKEHSHITEARDDVVWTIANIVREQKDIFYQLESPLGLKFSVNEFEINLIK